MRDSWRMTSETMALSAVEAGTGSSAGGGAMAAAVAAAAASPRIQQLNVSQKSHMHIGPKFVTVTQNVQNVEVVKALGLELEANEGETGVGPRRVRCGVAVFVCWALVVTCALAAGLMCALLLQHPALLDLDTGLCGCALEWVRRTSRAERVACAVALLALVVIATLLAVTLSRRATSEDPPDVAPHAWNITRAMWLARPATAPPLDKNFDPPKLVIVQHTAGPECHRFSDCAATMRHLQDWYLKDYLTDIPYNFLIGNEGRVYEGRGWALHGAHTLGLNRCSMGLGFVGDYRSSLAMGSAATEAQLNVTKRLLAWGVERGYLHPKYRVLAACDVQATASPGDRLLAALRTWDRYPPDPHRFFNQSCEYIYSVLRSEDDPSPTNATL